MDASLSRRSRELINQGCAPRIVPVPIQEPILSALNDARWVVLDLHEASRTRDIPSRDAAIRSALGRAEQIVSSLREANRLRAA